MTRAFKFKSDLFSTIYDTNYKLLFLGSNLTGIAPQDCFCCDKPSSNFMVFDLVKKDSGDRIYQPFKFCLDCSEEFMDFILKVDDKYILSFLDRQIISNPKAAILRANLFLDVIYWEYQELVFEAIILDDKFISSVSEIKHQVDIPQDNYLWWLSNDYSPFFEHLPTPVKSALNLTSNRFNL